MNRRKRRSRIVGLLAIFFVLALLTTGGLNPLERWLGWSGANWVWLALSTFILLLVAWNFLGFFIDKEGEGSHHDGDTSS